MAPGKYLAAVIVWPYLNNEVFVDKHKFHSSKAAHNFFFKLTHVKSQICQDGCDAVGIS